MTIKAIYSDELLMLLSNYIRDSLNTGEHINAWKNINAKDVVNKMRGQINGTTVTTFGRLKGFWYYKIYGTVAREGSENGPIEFNRILLKNRGVSSISITIAHEVAHRVGLSHPHSDNNMTIARKEPPYIIGDLTGQIVSGLDKIKP